MATYTPNLAGSVFDGKPYGAGDCGDMARFLSHIFEQGVRFDHAAQVLDLADELLTARRPPTVLRDSEGCLWIWVEDAYRAHGNRMAVGYTRAELEERWGECTVVAP